MSPISRFQILILWLLAFSFRSIVTLGVNNSAADTMMLNYPTAHSEHNKILGLILSFDLNHLDPLMLIAGEYVSMCESGWNVTFVLFTAANWTPKLKKLLHLKTYCYRVNDYIEIRYSVHDRSVGTNLATFHRAYVEKELNNFDFFVYHEDDIIFKNHHLSSYLSVTKQLYIDSPTYFETSIMGFQRFRRLIKTEEGRGTDWRDTDVVETDLIEESPEFVPMCVGNKPYVKVNGNSHQGMWTLTRGQILMLNDKCNFTSYKDSSREHMSSFSLFFPAPRYCEMRKLLPAATFSSFFIQHYYKQRHVSWLPTYDLVFKFYTQLDPPPDCWLELENSSVAELNDSSNITYPIHPISPKKRKKLLR